MRLRTDGPIAIGMADLTSFREIIELWSSREAMASDLAVRASTVSKWWQRGSIPAERWSAVLETNVAKSSGLTADTLTALAAREEARV